MSEANIEKAETEREKQLQEALGSRTLLVVLLAFVAVVELLIIVQLSM